MRDVDQIIQAHDLIVSFLLDAPSDVREGLSTEVMDAMVHSVDALCWVLGHQYNPRFAAKLDALRGLLAAAGLALVAMDSDVS